MPLSGCFSPSLSLGLSNRRHRAAFPHQTADFSSLVFDSVPVICDLFVTVLFVKSFADPSRTISKGAGRASLGKSAVRRFRSVSVKCKVTKNGNF